MPATVTTPLMFALPRSVPIPAHAHRRGYHRAYEVHARGGRCQLQRVRVHIHYTYGAHRVADYRQTYYEFFQFDRDDAHLVDTHDFDLARDSWRQQVIVNLVRKHRATGAAMPTGEVALRVCKQFSIAPGEVHGTAACERAAGAAFGLLAAGPSGPSRTRLKIARGDGSWATIDSLPPCPAGYPVQGSGTFAHQHALASQTAHNHNGGRAFESYRYLFANLTGRFTDRGAYLPHRIA